MSESNEERAAQRRGDPDAKEWAHARAAAFGEAVKFWRSKLGLTAVDLSSRTREVGYPITRATLAKIESNARNSKVDLAEVTALAAALRIAPIDLIYPGYPSQFHRVTPRSTMTATGCSDWFAGEESYEQHTDFMIGGPHAPTIVGSVELRRAVADYRSYCDSVSNRPEILKHPAPFGKEGSPIELQGASRYKSEVMWRYRRVEAAGGKVGLPFWFERLEEPQGHGDEGDGEG